MTRRELLTLSALGAIAYSHSPPSLRAAENNRLRMPGPFRGKVVAVRHSGSIVKGLYQAEAVRDSMRRGMMELTGVKDWREAWRYFFEPGDVVGIKLNPVGMPHIISSAEVVREIIAGLRAAGVKMNDIVAYDRYQRQFYQAGFDSWLPEGVRISSAAEDHDNIQQDIRGYDPDVYVDFPVTLPGYDLSNERARRSYAALFITKEVNKLVNLCLVKEHQSAGVTLALKNLSHGLVNNVSRSHFTRTGNSCGTFIPAVVSMPVIRDKAVLHILDGIKGQYNGGPSGRPQFIWEHKTMYFATDPVALDHTGWRVIDEKRVAMGLKPVAEDMPDQFSTFVRRQPEHVEIAGALGLGEFDLNKINLIERTIA